MRIVLQRVKKASVSVKGERVSSIKNGILLFLGVHQEDEEKDLEYLLKKVVTLRIKEDEKGKTNLSISPQEDEILLVSQFTLYADCRKGRRPSFSTSAKSDKGREYYLKFKELLEKEGFSVKTGKFGAMMEVSLVNDGPFTILLDSKNMIQF